MITFVGRKTNLDSHAEDESQSSKEIDRELDDMLTQRRQIHADDVS